MARAIPMARANPIAPRDQLTKMHDRLEVERLLQAWPP